MVLVLAVSLIFAFYAVAEPEDEARLTVTPDGGTAEVTTGTYDEMMALVAGSMPSSVATEYRLELLSDAKSSACATLAGGELDSLVIDLGGHVLTAGEGLVSASGAFSFEIYGGYTLDVERGSVVSGASAAVITLSGVKAEIGDVVINAPECINATDSDVRLRGAELCSVAADDGVIKLNNTKITLWESGVVSGGTAIDASASTVRLQNAYITAARAVKTVGSAITLIDTEIDADEAFYADAVSGDKVYLGGATLRADDITAGALTAAEVELWYGTGSTAIAHADPTSELTVKTAKAQLTQVGGIWTLRATATTAAMVTTFADGAAPVEYTGTITNCFKQFQSVAPEVPTAFAMTLLNDYAHSGSAAPFTNGNVNATLFFDLNGFNINRTTKNSNIFTASGDHKLSINGADALGNVGALNTNTTTGAFLYNKSAAVDAVLSISDITLRYTNHSNSSPTPMLQLVEGYAYLDGLRFVYDGTERDEGAEVKTIPMLSVQGTAKALITNSEFDGRNEAGIPSRAMSASSGTAWIFAKNIKANVSYGASTTSTSGNAVEIRIADSDITADTLAYSKGRDSCPMTVTDTRTVITGSKLASGSVYFPYGDGKTAIVTDSDKLSGDQQIEEGFAFSFSSEEGAYFMEDSSQFTTVKLNPIFSDGMVLQANKEIRVFGTCDTVGATIEVVIGEVSATSTVAADNTFCVTLPAMGYARGVSVYVNELGLKNPTTRLDGVDIGEIWMMSGQSNSVYGVYKMEDYEEYLRNADNYDNIRVFSISQAQSLVEKDSNTNSGWYQANSDTLSKDDRYTGISAIAYVMATRLAVELGEDVTIGILDINFNGSTVEAWMSAENLAEVDPATSSIYNAYKNFYVKNGTYPSESDVAGYGTYVASDKLYQRMACACYNAMIAPYEGFAIRGAVWYQGEGNAGSVNETEDGNYAQHFRGVRNSFRDAFGDENLPVFIIQIPPRMGNPFYFKALQYDLANEDANTYVVASHLASSTYSDNELKYTGPDSDGMVHYERKSPLGLALADSVLENVYYAGEGLKISAPKILSVVSVGRAIRITFDRELAVDMGSEMIGFEIAGPGTEWVAAKASYENCVVTLTADGVSAPNRVRYGAQKSILVLEDGTEIIHNKSDGTFKYNEAEKTVTITYDGKTYIIHTSDPEVIGARSVSNVVAANGSTLPVFLINVEQ